MSALSWLLREVCGNGVLCCVGLLDFVLHLHTSQSAETFFGQSTTATLGNALTYIYPALMYNAIVKKQNKKGESVGLLVSNVAAVLGVVMGAIGTKLALGK